MPRKVFTDGEILFAEDVNIIGKPFVDGEDVLGHGDKILDNSLSDEPNNIKSRFYQWYDRFRVSLSSGLSVSVANGLVNAGGNIINIPPQNFVVTDNTTVFLWIGTISNSSSVQLRESVNLPDNCIPLARVSTSGGSVISITDLREIAADLLPPAIPEAIPIGTIIYSLLPLTVSAPSGFVELGAVVRNVSRTTYAALFNLFGTFYGTGDGSTTFGLPAIGNKYVKMGDIGVAPGATGGNNTISLSTSQLPSHSHVVIDPGHNHTTSDPGHNHGVSDPGHNHSVSDPGHSHGLPGYLYDRGASENDDGQGSAYETRGNTTYVAATGVGVNASGSNIGVNGNVTGLSINNRTTGVSTQNTGSGGIINNEPAYITMRVFIKF